jgi:hypothetical protein
MPKITSATAMKIKTAVSQQMDPAKGSEPPIRHGFSAAGWLLAAVAAADAGWTTPGQGEAVGVEPKAAIVLTA